MKDIAPDIFRQRFLIEGFWTITVDEATVRSCLLNLAKALSLRTYGDPIVFSPASGMGKQENSGFDAFVPLIDSGIAGYFWTSRRFFSIVIYSCKGFEEKQALDFLKEFLHVEGEMVSHKF